MVIVLFVTKHFLSPPAHLSATGVAGKTTDSYNGLPYLNAVVIFLPLYFRNNVP